MCENCLPIGVVSADDVYEVLKTVEDPELPVSIVDMGLIYDVEIHAGETTCAEIDMTFTAMGCPAMDFMKHDVREAVAGLEGVDEIEINTVWDPPWSTDRLSDEARQVLQTAGVGV